MEKKKGASDAVSDFGQHPQQEEGKDVRLFIANPDFLLREIGGEAVLVPVGEAGVFENSVISLNDTCRFLWQQFLAAVPDSQIRGGCHRGSEEGI